MGEQVKTMGRIKRRSSFVVCCFSLITAGVIAGLLHVVFSLSCNARDITAPLNVPFFSQRDSRWGCNKLGSCLDSSKCNTGTVTHSTIYRYGCFLTSKAMLFNYYESEYTDPGELNSCLLNSDGYVQDTADSGYKSGFGYCLMNWNNACVPSGVSYINSKSGDIDSLSSDIDAELTSGYPVLADVRYNTTDCNDKTKQHMVLIVAKSGSSYIVKDPWDEADTERTLNDGALGSGSYHVCKIHIFRYFKIGDGIKAIASVNIREKPGTTSTTKCTASTENTGKIVGGPQQANNDTWWQISWDDGTGNCTNGTTGWSVANYIRRIVDEDTSSSITHTLTPPSKTTVSQGGVLGPFTVEGSNNSSFYYAYYGQPYVTKPDGTTLNFIKKISTGLGAGETRTVKGYLYIPASSELGTFTFGVKLTDTSGNLIDNDSFKFTIVSSSSVASKRSVRLLKRLMRNREAQVVEEDGWKVIIVPEKDK